MKYKLSTIGIALSSLCFCAGAMAQSGEIRVLVANHPYGELLKLSIPQFEKSTGIKVNVESLQESQLTQKLTTEFATKSSSVDVFMTRPLQEGKMFYKNGWYEPLTGYDFTDYPKNIMNVASFGGKPYIVPLVTEWQVLYYRKDLLQQAGLKVPTNFDELEAAAKKLNSESVAGFASRGKGAAAVTQFSSYVYNYGGQYLDKGTAVFNSKPAIDAIRFYGKTARQLRPERRDLDVMGKHHAAVPGRQGRHVDRRLGVLRPDRRSSQDPDPGGQFRHCQLPGRTQDEFPVHRLVLGHRPWPTSRRKRTWR